MSSSPSASSDIVSRVEAADADEPLLSRIPANGERLRGQTGRPAQAPSVERTGHPLVLITCLSVSLTTNLVLLLLLLVLAVALDGRTGLWPLLASAGVNATSTSWPTSSTADVTSSSHSSSFSSWPTLQSTSVDSAAAEHDDDELRALASLSDVALSAAWKQPLRESAAISSRVSRRQRHTAVCINFNKPPRLEALATILTVHGQLHRYLTIVSPVPLGQLPTPLPASVRHIECVQQSVLVHDEQPAQRGHTKGLDGTLQHICAAACFDYYASAQFAERRLRGVVWQADDMFVNYSALFAEYAANKSWSPSHSRDSLFPLTQQSMYDGRGFWTSTPVGNLFAAQHAIRLLQSTATYREAWLLAFGSLDSMADKAMADFFYVPNHQLRTFVDVTNVLRQSSEQYVTVADTANRSRTVTVRVGLTMCEWWTASQLRLTAAIHALQSEPSAAFDSCDLSEQLQHVASALLYAWGDTERNNYSRMHDYCYRPDIVAVHPLKLSVPQYRQMYVEAYGTMRTRAKW